MTRCRTRAFGCDMTSGDAHHTSVRPGQLFPVPADLHPPPKRRSTPNTSAAVSRVWPPNHACRIGHNPACVSGLARDVQIVGSVSRTRISAERLQRPWDLERCVELRLHRHRPGRGLQVGKASGRPDCWSYPVRKVFADMEGFLHSFGIAVKNNVGPWKYGC